MKTGEIVDEAVIEAAETMAFMTLLPDEEIPAPQECMLVEMRFEGPECGRIEILAPVDFCSALARNIAATDKVDVVVRADALKEFCNVTCGLILPRLAHSEADVFDVSVPSLRRDDSTPSWSQFCAVPGTTVLNIDGFAVAARVVCENVQA